MGVWLGKALGRTALVVYTPSLSSPRPPIEARICITNVDEDFRDLDVKGTMMSEIGSQICISRGTI